jgi:uncharacterized glyoxalase superfamily protein PhnB
MANKRLITPLTPELCCSNIKISLLFYTEVLGFDIQYQREEDGLAMLERQGSRIMLGEIRKNSVSETDRIWIAGSLEAPFGRGINLEMEINKVDELYDRVKKAGANVFLPNVPGSEVLASDIVTRLNSLSAKISDGSEKGVMI